MKNNMREPVILEIYGVSYEVDIEKQVLRQTSRPDHEIFFVRDMHDDGNHYHLRYNIREHRAELGNGTDVRKILIPQMTKLDPEGMAARLGRNIEEIRGLSDFELLVDQQTLELRRKGVLPELEIMGERFIIDLKRQEFRHTQDFAPVIRLSQFRPSDDGRLLEAYYHPLLKTPVDIDPQLTAFPDHVVKISLPNEIALDPVGAAALYKFDERKALRIYPLKLNHEATVTALAETDIPRLIRQNRERLQQEHAENARKFKPRTRPRF